MKTKTSELTGAALDWAVAKCELDVLACKNIQYPECARHYPKVSPSTNWAQGGPIIERERITTDGNTILGQWMATIYVQNEEPWEMRGPTLLIAAMRCFVASKMGDEIELPDELTA